MTEPTYTEEELAAAEAEVPAVTEDDGPDPNDTEADEPIPDVGEPPEADDDEDEPITMPEGAPDPATDETVMTIDAGDTEGDA